MRRAGIILLLTAWAGCASQGAGPEAPAHWLRPTNWAFEDSTLWRVSDTGLELVSAGAIPADIRRPGSVATARGTEDLGSFHLRASVRSSQDSTVVGRDVIIVFGYRSPREFYYAHLSNDNTVMPHNGIFLVNHADRHRIDDQGVDGAPEARLVDSRWHEVRVDRDTDTGAIRVFMDDLRAPLLTATDTTLRSGAVGFGSFDDIGEVRDVRVARGHAPLLDPIAEQPLPATMALKLAPFATIPASDTTGGPAARINTLAPAPDGSGRVFVPDLRGMLFVIEGTEVRPFLDVADAFPDFVDQPGLGSGFGYVAFHPEYGTNGIFYTVHTEGGKALSEHRPDFGSSGEDVIHGVLTEWTSSRPGAGSFEGTHREVLRIGFRAVLHGIQQIAFHPQAVPDDEEYGLLYVAVGDGEAPGGQTVRPQSLEAISGKILRIDPTGRNSQNGSYGIPEGNPFFDHDHALREIWALGLRNPHRFSWDSETGRMWIGHIGEARVDAVFEGLPGANYGWNEQEGGFRYEREDPLQVYPSEGSGTFEDPVLRLDHDELAALVGGFVYRGKGIPNLRGTYVFGDLNSGRLYAWDPENPGPVAHLAIVDESGREVTMAGLAGRPRAEIRFGMDASGELYVLSKANGGIWKVVDAIPVRRQTTGS